MSTSDTPEDVARAFDIISIKMKGRDAITNYDLNSYDWLDCRWIKIQSRSWTCFSQTTFKASKIKRQKMKKKRERNLSNWVLGNCTKKGCTILQHRSIVGMKLYWMFGKEKGSFDSVVVMVRSSLFQELSPVRIPSIATFGVIPVYSVAPFSQ